MDRFSKLAALTLPALLAVACEESLVEPGMTEFSPAAAKAGAGGRILFVSDRAASAVNPTAIDVFVMNADGSALTNLTNHPDNDGSPVWSSNGKQIAFTSDRDGDRDVFVMNADGTGLTNLTRHARHDSSPDW